MKSPVFYAAALLSLLLLASKSSAERPNLLIITVDDMSADSIGEFGCRLADTTPHIDRLARSGLKFMNAHVQVGNCMPSRNVMWSGLYPHHNRVEGFYQVPTAEHPTLTTLMKNGGYFTAIRGKVTHSTPYHPYPWDLVLDTLADGSKAHVKDPASYGESTRLGIQAARKSGKPFCLMINVADPHKPFYAQGKKGETVADRFVPSRVFQPREVPIPGFLFEDPVVRQELAQYYSTVRRSDDAVGSILKALDQAGERDSTCVMFLSDHGMPLPFAKTQLYHHSTHTPLIIRWPGVTQPASRDSTHMVSAVDFLPTLLDVAQVRHGATFDGRSFEPLIRGKKQEGRDFVIKVYNENSGASRDPMRGIQTRKYLYLYNAWANGERVFATATSGTQTYRQMAKRAASDPALKQRLDHYRNRVVEEFYDVTNDPDCLVNLVTSGSHAQPLRELRDRLADFLAESGDHMAPVRQQPGNAAARENYVQEKEKEALERKKLRRPRQPAKKKPRQKKEKQLIRLVLPEKYAPQGQLVVRIPHNLPAEMGKQQVHVTLKTGKSPKRLERKMVQIAGQGEATVEFKLPGKVADRQIRIAAFVGPSYEKSIQYLQSGVIPEKE